MTSSDSFIEFVLDQLGDLGRVDCVRMFGGHGLYRDGVFFAVLSAGKLYFKIDDATRPDYERRGMAPFRPNERQTLSSYYEVPVDILEDSDALTEWAQKAIQAQLRAGKTKRPRGSKKKIRRNDD